MKNLSFLILILALSLNSCKKDKKQDNVVEEVVTKTEVVTPKKVTVALSAKSGSNATGNVVFKEENGTVTMTAILSGLDAGSHAIHIHQTSDCSSPDGKSTGGHWNPTNQSHGKWGALEGYHKGDIGNFIADENGNGTITHTTDEWCIGCDDDTKNILNKGIIVHAGTDDFITQPTGAAGGRVSCGGIIQ